MTGSYPTTHPEDRELVRLLAVRAELPVILYSGDTTAVVERARAAGIREVLEKPVSLTELGGAVRRVLD